MIILLLNNTDLVSNPKKKLKDHNRIEINKTNYS